MQLSQKCQKDIRIIGSLQKSRGKPALEGKISQPLEILIMVRTTKLRPILAAAVLLFLTACGSIGPGNVTRDRFGYTHAIAESWKKQMLLNMVKMRYVDVPVFLDVTTIINQYSLEGEVELGLNWSSALLGNSQSVGGRGRYADRPTVTYQPLMGEKFTRKLMNPIPPPAILSLVQTGWRIDMLFRVCVQAINGIQNRAGGRLDARSADPDFYRLIALLRKIQASAAMGMRIQRTKDKKQTAVMLFRKKNIEPEIEEKFDAVKKLLGLNPELREFNVVYGFLAKDDREIAIQSRSMMEILGELAAYIDVPAAHVTERSATPAMFEEGAMAADIPPLIRVKSDSEEPDDAFAAIRYRDHWFWIDHRDLKSKRVFSFLMFLFSLAESGTPRQAPVVTIPVG